MRSNGRFAPSWSLAHPLVAPSDLVLTRHAAPTWNRVNLRTCAVDVWYPSRLRSGLGRPSRLCQPSRPIWVRRVVESADVADTQPMPAGDPTSPPGCLSSMGASQIPM